MKLLFLANRVPYPPYRGDKLKIFNLAKRLAPRHELHLLTFAQTPEDLQYKQELEKIFKAVHFVYLPKWKSAIQCLAGAWDARPLQVLYFNSPEMRSQLDALLKANTYDAIHVQHLRMSPYLRHRKDLARILDLPDAFSLYWERRKTVKRGLLTRIFETQEQKRVERFEPVLNDYNMSLVCSAEDLEYLQAHRHAHNLKLLPNGVDLTTFKARDHDYTQNATLLFTGNMDYAPNIDAVVHFVHNIFPLVKAQFPEAKFIIAGQRPVKKVLELASEDVVVTGFIKDLSETYNTADVVVAPLRFGAGTQNKVLEAMAMGVPVVCSHIGFKGLGIDDGQGAYMRTDPTAFAEAVNSLLASQALRESVGRQGMQVVQNSFNWDKIALKLEGYFEEVRDTHRAK